MSSLELAISGPKDGVWAMCHSVEDISPYNLVTSARDGVPEHVQDANSSVAGKRPAWGLTLERLNNGNGRVLLIGFATNSNWSFSPGAILYLAGVDGQITEIEPGISQEVGWALTATTIYFFPKCLEILI